jgi:hypothetical protein
MEEIKICPDCASEYYAYIESCADCGAALLTQEEHKRREEEKQLCMAKALENQATIRTGDLRWMRELYAVLIETGIPCSIRSDAGCSKGCCGDTHQLMVSSEDAEQAQKRIEEYYMEIHPELQASQEMLSEGNCPACSCRAGSDAVVCPDCGLTLIIKDSE